MTAFNVVRFKVKPGNEQEFIDFHRRMTNPGGMKGFVSGSLVKTGDQTFCMIGEWRSFQSIVNARPQMIGMLDQMRSLLEDLGADLGVTDPVSGESVVKFGPPKKAAKKKAAKPAKRSAGKKAGAKSKARKGMTKKSAARKRKR
jgi:antibiotic biosynthesis monooxygenase